MTSHITNRVRQNARRAQANAESLRNTMTQLTCPQARGIAAAEAIAWQQFARHLMGDIGEEQTEIDAEPVEIPTTVPAEPVKVPA